MIPPKKMDARKIVTDSLISRISTSMSHKVFLIVKEKFLLFDNFTLTSN